MGKPTKKSPAKSALAPLATAALAPMTPVVCIQDWASDQAPDGKRKLKISKGQSGVLTLDTQDREDPRPYTVLWKYEKGEFPLRHPSHHINTVFRARWASDDAPPASEGLL